MTPTGRAKAEDRADAPPAASKERSITQAHYLAAWTVDDDRDA